RLGRRAVLADDPAGRRQPRRRGGPVRPGRGRDAVHAVAGGQLRGGGGDGGAGGLPSRGRGSGALPPPQSAWRPGRGRRGGTVRAGVWCARATPDPYTRATLFAPAALYVTTLGDAALPAEANWATLAGANVDGDAAREVCAYTTRGLECTY